MFLSETEVQQLGLNKDLEPMPDVLEEEEEKDDSSFKAPNLLTHQGEY